MLKQMSKVFGGRGNNEETAEYTNSTLIGFAPGNKIF